MNALLRTEKEMPRCTAVAWIVLNSSCSRRMFPRVERGGSSLGETIHVGKHQSSRDHEVERRDINEEKQRRDRGALRGPNGDRGWGARCALEDDVQLRFPRKEATQETR